MSIEKKLNSQQNKTNHATEVTVMTTSLNSGEHKRLDKTADTNDEIAKQDAIRDINHETN